MAVGSSLCPYEIRRYSLLVIAQMNRQRIEISFSFNVIHVPQLNNMFQKKKKNPCRGTPTLAAAERITVKCRSIPKSLGESLRSSRIYPSKKLCRKKAKSIAKNPDCYVCRVFWKQHTAVIVTIAIYSPSA